MATSLGILPFAQNRDPAVVLPWEVNAFMHIRHRGVVAPFLTWPAPLVAGGRELLRRCNVFIGNLVLFHIIRQTYQSGSIAPPHRHVEQTGIGWQKTGKRVSSACEKKDSNRLNCSDTRYTHSLYQLSSYDKSMRHENLLCPALERLAPSEDVEVAERSSEKSRPI